MYDFGDGDSEEVDDDDGDGISFSERELLFINIEGLRGHWRICSVSGIALLGGGDLGVGGRAGAGVGGDSYLFMDGCVSGAC